MTTTMLLLILVAAIVQAYKPINKVLTRVDTTEGIDGKNGQFNFLASILAEGTHICAGVIIGNDWVLTIAKCLHYYDKTVIPNSKLTILAGSRFWGNGLRYNVFRKVIHEQYKSTSTRNNIALIQSEVKFKWDLLLAPIPMNLKGVKEKSSAMSCGWGYGELQKKVARIPAAPLKYINVKIKPAKKVQSSHGSELYVDASGGICSGGYGSALIQDDQLIGVLSQSPSCESKSHETFTKVQYYADWINRIILNPLDLKPIGVERRFVAKVQQSVLGQIPYIGIMVQDEEHLCTVALAVYPKFASYVLSPAHCFYDDEGDFIEDYFIEVYVGSDGYKEGPAYHTSAVTLHPSYKLGSFKHDIAVLKLLQPLPRADLNVQPLPRDINFTIDSGDIIVTVVTWATLKGRNLTLEKTFPSYTQMLAMSSVDCARYHKFIDQNHFCGVNVEGDGVCNVDPGSPVVHNNKIVGFVVTGGACNGVDPQVYTRLSAYEQWIADFESKH